MKKFLVFLCAMLLVFGVTGTGSTVSAATITYEIESLYNSPFISTVYTGTGFVGMHSTKWSDFFMYETYETGSEHSETIMQVDISSILGSTITSATLEYTLLSGSVGGTGDLLLTSFYGDGTLEYWFPDPDSVVEQDTFTVADMSTASLDILDMVVDNVTAGEAWLGLYFEMATYGHSHYTYTDFDADAANVSLTVEYNPVPEPATMLLLGSGLVGLAGFRRKYKK